MTDLERTCFSDGEKTTSEMGVEDSVEVKEEIIEREENFVQEDSQNESNFESNNQIPCENSEEMKKSKKVLEEYELTHENVVDKVEERLELPSDESFKKPKTKKEKTKKWLTSLLFIAFNVIAVGIVLFIEIPYVLFYNLDKIRITT